MIYGTDLKNAEGIKPEQGRSLRGKGESSIFLKKVILHSLSVPILLPTPPQIEQSSNTLQQGWSEVTN